MADQETRVTLLAYLREDAHDHDMRPQDTWQWKAADEIERLCAGLESINHTLRTCEVSHRGQTVTQRIREILTGMGFE